MLVQYYWGLRLWPAVWAELALTFACASSSYYLIERPFLRLKRHFAAPLKLVSGTRKPGEAAGTDATVIAGQEFAP